MPGDSYFLGDMLTNPFLGVEMAHFRDDYEPDDDAGLHGKRESNFTTLTINDIMDEQMSQINRIAELFEVRV